MIIPTVAPTSAQLPCQQQSISNSLLQSLRYGWGPVHNQRRNSSENKLLLHRWFNLFRLRSAIWRRGLPAENPYDNLKSQLIKHTTTSKQWRLQQFFNTKELGDHNPTQLWCWMQHMMGNKAIDSSSFASPFSSISLIFADKVMDIVAPSMTAGGTSQIAIDVELQRYRDQRTSLTIGRHPRWSEYSPSHSLGQLLSASFAFGIGLIMGTINCKFCDLGRNHNT